MRASGISELIACLGLLGGSWPLREAEDMQGRVLVVLAPEEPRLENLLSALGSHLRHCFLRWRRPSDKDSQSSTEDLN